MVTHYDDMRAMWLLIIVKGSLSPINNQANSILNVLVNTFKMNQGLGLRVVTHGEHWRTLISHDFALIQNDNRKVHKKQQKRHY